MNRCAVVTGGMICLLVLAACSGYRTTLTPTFAVTEEFTDNVDATSENPQSDFITSISPGLTLSAINPKRELALSYSPSFTYYAKTGTDFTIGHSADLSMVNRFSRHTTLELSDAFTRTDDPYVRSELGFEREDEPQQPPDTTRRENREVFYTNSATLAFRHAFGRDDSFYVRYLNSILRNDDPTEEDSTQNSPSFGVTYWLSPRYGVDAGAQYTRGDFSLDTDPFNEYTFNMRFIRRVSSSFNVFVQYIQTMMNFQGEDEDYQVYDATVGVDYSLSKSTFLSLSTGYFFRVPDETESQGGYVLRGDMARRFSRGAVRLSGGTGYRQTFFQAENLGFTEFYEGTVAGTYTVTRNISALAQAGYTHNTYNDEDDREDDVIAMEAGLSYLIRSWLTASLRYTHRRTESTEPGDSFDENRVSLNLNFVPTTPWVFD